MLRLRGLTVFSMPADSYHTLYCLVGLSAAQHNVYLLPARYANEQLRKTSLEVLSWAEEEGGSHVLGGSANRVNATHPIFTLTTEALMSHFYRQAISRSK
ncbi:hypothetical protein EDD16DRAFT_1645538 [Pisolithus croceorrhizus]|nr:hypothetical protein EDD16DRAFT_1645538 [Pisolithus croceorrhizus]